MGGAGLALALFVPGFDSPGYYSALSLALLGGLVAGPIGVVAGRRALVARKNPFVAALHAVAPAAFAPLAILLLNGVRVQQCDVWSGVFFYLLGPPLTCAFAAFVGAGCAAFARRYRFAVPLYYFVWLAWVALDLLHLYRHPAIFAYNPFGGFFSGAVYDTVIEIDWRIVLYRLNNLAQALFIVTLVRLAWDRIEGRMSLDAASHAPARRWLAWLATVAACLVFWSSRGAIGYEIDRPQIQRELGGVIRGPRLVLWYSKEHINESEAQSLYEDHLFRLDQLAERLGPYPETVTSYVYGTNDQKRRLMGAAQVYIAKPWLHEIHLNHVPYGAAVVRHELAHVVLGVFAPAPFHIPTADFIPVPQMALVEGAAEAFEWDTGQLDSHEWACAMRQAKLAPPLDDILGPDGFYKQSSDKAYTLSGSFIRWLMDTQGPARFERVYRDGDFEGVYGVPLPQLVSDWGAFVDALKVPDDAAGLATGRYNTVAVFYRPCGLDVARTESEAAKRSAAGDRDGAREAYEQVVAWIPKDPQKRLPLLSLAVSGNDLATAERIFADYMALTEGRNPVSDAYATELLADVRWRTGDVDAAAKLYASVAGTPSPEDRRRNILVKAWVAADKAHQIVGSYLLDGQLGTLDKVAAALPNDPLVDYLVGRRRALDRKLDEAIPLLEASTRDLPDDAFAPWVPWVRRETWRLLGQARFDAKRYAEAAAAFETFARLTPYGGDRARYLDWAERARWKMARESAPHGQEN